jgi:hypothetical protein
MKPNSEFAAIEAALAAHLEEDTVAESAHRIASEACDFLTDCKWAMRPPQFSFRKLGACFATANLMHRRILLDEVGAMLFRAKPNQTKILYAELLQEAYK